MSITRIKINEYFDDLFCVYSKERIHIGDKYVEVTEDSLGEKIVKTYHLEYAPEESEDDGEPYILKDDE